MGQFNYKHFDFFIVHEVIIIDDSLSILVNYGSLLTRSLCLWGLARLKSVIDILVRKEELGQGSRLPSLLGSQVIF